MTDEVPMLSLVLAAVLVASQPVVKGAALSPAESKVPGALAVASVPGSGASEARIQDEPPQMPGWPVTTGRHPNFVPTRGATFADLDGDGTPEILLPCTLGQLYAWKLDGSLVPGFPVSTVGFPQYPPTVADLDGDGQVEIVQTTRGFTNGGRLYVFNKNGQVLSGWPKNINNNNIEYCATLADLDNDGKLEIIAGERAYPIGRLHVFEKDGTEWGGNWPVTIDHVPTMTASVGDVDGDGNKEVFYCSYNSMYLIRRDGTIMPGWPKQIPNANFSYQSAALADLDNDGKLEIVVGAHNTGAGCYVYRYDGTLMPGWPKLFQTWSYCPPTVTDLEGDGSLEILDGQAGYVSGPSNGFWVWNTQGQAKSGFPFVIDHGGGCEGPLNVADVDGDGIQEIFADHNEMVNNQGYLYGLTSTGQNLPGFPLRTNGFTYMNGATIGDLDNDGDYELGVVAYNDTTVTLYLYTLPWHYQKSGLEWPTYHARNVRGGLFSPAKTLVPTAYRVARGNQTGGNLGSLASVDNDELTVKNGLTLFPGEHPINVEFDSTSPLLAPGTMEANLTFRASTGGLAYTMEFFDFAANAWDSTDAKTGAAPTAKATVTMTGTNVARYVQTGTGLVRYRVKVKFPNLALTNNYSISIDAARWKVGG
ncbi:MAG: VCBS repeat-containing protein [Armatimonadetes bacterium]|nr:VCBS repeat-containing protein [Armatimonadota bacterium]